MITLKLSSFPDNLYSQIETLAKKHNRSLDSEVIALLQKAIQHEKTYPDQAKLLAEIRCRHISSKNQYHLDSVQMLREDRAG